MGEDICDYQPVTDNYLSQEARAIFQLGKENCKVEKMKQSNFFLLLIPIGFEPNHPLTPLSLSIYYQICLRTSFKHTQTLRINSRA
jgi:hypothetical protein